MFVVISVLIVTLLSDRFTRTCTLHVMRKIDVTFACTCTCMHVLHRYVVILNNIKNRRLHIRTFAMYDTPCYFTSLVKQNHTN